MDEPDIYNVIVCQSFSFESQNVGHSWGDCLDGDGRGITHQRKDPGQGGLRAHINPTLLCEMRLMLA